MRFSRVHKVSVYTVAVLGLFALGSGGMLEGAIGAVIAAGVIASWWAEGALLESRAYARFQTGLLLVVLLFQIARATLGGHALLDAAVEFAALLQVSRLAFRRTASEYQQSTALALAHLIAATVLGAGLSYAVCFIGFVITLPWALTLGHLRREIEGNYLADARAGRAGVPIDVARILRSRRVVGSGLLVGSSLLSIPIFAMTALLFVLFPRIGFGVFSLRQSRGAATAGLGDEVDLTGHGTIRDDPTIVLRVEPPDMGDNPPASRTFRLRGAAFDVYDGHAWSRRTLPRATVPRDMDQYELYSRRTVVRGEQRAYRLTLDGLDPPVVLVPPGTVRLRIEPRLEAGYRRYTDVTRDVANELRYASQDDLGLVYTAFVPDPIVDDLGHFTADRAPLDAASSARYLQLPTISPRLLALAHQLTDSHATATQKAEAVERYLRAFRYTLTIESGSAEQPVEDFLFRTHAGHCEYFSTAMAILLRAVGVHTRNVTGFLGGTYNHFGRFYAVRQGDAHSWVEVYDPAVGWITFDPTPPSREPLVARTGLLAELDAVVEAFRARWRHYVVGFDLSTQLKLFQGAFRMVEWSPEGGWLRGRGRAQQRGVQQAATDQRRPLRTVFIVLGGVALVGAAWWFNRRAKNQTTPQSQTVKSAIALAKALDQTLIQHGYPRSVARSPLAHARDLLAKKIAIGPLAELVAIRWAEARYGQKVLTLDELADWKRRLKEFVSEPQ
jgi:transglutaminase-like putative cysteine protease